MGPLYPTHTPPIDTRDYISVSVKDSVTSRLPTQRPIEGMEASGLVGCLMMPKFKFVQGYGAEDGSTREVGKTAFVPPNPEKGKLSMG